MGVNARVRGIISVLEYNLRYGKAIELITLLN